MQVMARETIIFVARVFRCFLKRIFIFIQLNKHSTLQLYSNSLTFFDNVKESRFFQVLRCIYIALISCYLKTRLHFLECLKTSF